MADNKNNDEPTKLSVARYIETLTARPSPPTRKALVRLMRAASGEKPTMWEHPSSASAIATTSTKAVERAICRSSLFHRARPLRSLPFGVEQPETLLAKLGKHSTGKGCLYIKKVADVNPTYCNPDRAIRVQRTSQFSG